MTQTERRLFLIKRLLDEQPQYKNIAIPKDAAEQKRLFRSLVNIRYPGVSNNDFLKVQDEYLQEEIAVKGITNLSELIPVQEDIYLWQGDITTLKCGAIVNAANNQMTGCYIPCHGCIDNAIHTFAGIQLRLECAEIMKKQGYPEPTGKAKITKAYNLPCEYVLHTVGPIIRGEVTKNDEQLLSDCYRSCLTLAKQYGVDSIAFCCISTGEFHFPNRRAAEIAINAVKEYKATMNSTIKVVFNVFKNKDYEIYNELLRAN